MTEPAESSPPDADAPQPESGFADELVLEETHGDDDESAGLELDPRQATEIRQIFLTTLPDYLAPVRQMVEQLIADPGGDGEIERTLTKTLSSIAAAASRVGIEDVSAKLQTLREDVLLLVGSGDPDDPLREKIMLALSALDQLASGSTPGAAQQQRGETIVAAFRAIQGIEPSAPEKLMAAGVVHVEQLLRADPREVAAVSGLELSLVQRIVFALSERRAASAAPAAETSAPQPSEPARDPALAVIERQVDNELGLDEVRAEILNLRLSVRRLRDDVAEVEKRREQRRRAVTETQRAIAERSATLTRVEELKARLERELVTLKEELERRALRVEALRAERRAAADEHARLAREVAAMSRRVDRVLRGPLSS